MKTLALYFITTLFIGAIGAGAFVKYQNDRLAEAEARAQAWEKRAAEWRDLTLEAVPADRPSRPSVQPSSVQP